MQNKPNSRKAKMNLSSCSTKDYENEPRLRTPAKQTQSNPILSAIAGFYEATAKENGEGGFKGQAAGGNATGEFLSNQGGKRAKFSNFSLKSRSYHD